MKKPETGKLYSINAHHLQLHFCCYAKNTYQHHQFDVHKS